MDRRDFLTYTGLGAAGLLLARPGRLIAAEALVDAGIDLAIKKALADPKVKDIMEKYDFTERYMGPADYTKFVTEVVASEKAAVERLGLVTKD